MAGDLEEALAETEREARAAQRAAEVAVKAAKRAVAAAVTGDVNQMAKALADTRQAVGDLSLQLRNTNASWTFDAKAYAETGALAEELKSAATAEGLSIYEQDGRLFCYPALLRILPSEPGVEIDRKKLKSVRPSHIVRQLKVLRNRPQRFKPEQFLEVLFRAYEWARKSESGVMGRLDGRGPVIELASLFELLTLFPDAQKDYGRAEFTRDIYMLDRSRVATTRAGSQLELSASTGTNGSATKLFR
ncbi:MAG: hypothetical protein ACRDG3_08395, partial [Tepidiformaceae bacterium]